LRLRAAFLCGATFVALGGLKVASPGQELICLFHDDAFYYLQTARNFAAGHGSSFDGLHRTNGYHPLWFLLLTAVTSLIRDDTALLRAVLLLQIGLVSAAAALLWRLLRRAHGATAGATGVALVLGLPGTPTSLAMGMEGAALLVCLVALWDVWSARPEAAGGREDRAGYALLGALCSAAALARLEAFVLVPAVVLAERRRFRKHPAEVVSFLAIPIATLMLYVGINLALFGAPLPISGAVKAAAGTTAGWRKLDGLLELPWPGLASLTQRMAPGPGHLVQGLALLAAVACAFLAGLGTRARWILCAFALWLLSDVLLMGSVEPWNGVPLLLAVVLGAAVAAERWPRAARVLVAILACAVAVRVAGSSAAGQGSYAPYRLAAAHWIRENVPADARVGSWNAGTLGFAARRPVVNLDGLVNDRRYAVEVLRDHRLEPYLRRERIGWIADQACAGEPTARPYLSRTGSEHLESRLVLAAVFANADGPGGCPGYAVWKLVP